MIRKKVKTKKKKGRNIANTMNSELQKNKKKKNREDLTLLFMFSG